MIKKIKEQEEARRLRQMGYSIRQIEHNLRVSRASVSTWVRDVQLSEDQKKELKKRNPALNGDPKKYRQLGSISIKKYALHLREQYQEEGRALARQNDPYFIAGIMLYWAEGSKSRNSIMIGNTDVNLMKFFVKFLLNFFDIKEKDFVLRLYCHLNNGITLDQIEKYWMTQLGLTEGHLNKTYIEQKRIVTGKRKNIHKYGVCNIAVHRTDIVQKIFGAIQEYVGFENPTWLG